jgi:dTDP-4-dehydrorhamnose reductase
VVARGTPLDGGRVLVLGAAGMLGSQVLLDAPVGFEPVAAVRGGTLPELPRAFPLVGGVDAAEPLDVDAALRFVGDACAVVHCAAYTNVDGAEADPAAAERANALSPEVVARACAQRGIPLVLLSTDFVFDGRAREPYDEGAPTAPLSVYGRTKLAGEQRALAAHPDGTAVVRTQWLYGPRGRHFPGTILRLAREGKPLRVVADQIGCPTSTSALAPALWDVLRLGGRGIFHAACAGRASWYEFARETLALAGVAADLSPCSTAEFPRPAARPAFSVLSCRRLADLRGAAMPDWQGALASFLAT